MFVFFFFFFFKQKTAYEMRISDWSSDVCSSDLRFRYAQFDEAGRCTAIMSSAVDLGLPHRVDGDVRPEDIHLSQGEVRPCRAVTLSASRTILLCDGRDAISIDGLPEGAALLIHGTIVQSPRVSSRAPGTLVVEPAGRSEEHPSELP